MLERRVGNGTSYTRHGILFVFARYFGAVGKTANDVSADREHRPSVVSMFDISWKHGYTVDSVISIYQPTNAHTISHKTLLKHFKTLRLVSILSDHHQGALFLAKVILQYSQFNSDL